MRWLLVLLLVPAALAACGSGNGRANGSGPSGSPMPSGELTVRTSGGPVTLSVQIADTPEARARGLMGRTSLAADHGMAFVFDGPTNERFWMKDTLIPLSIAFWDSEHRIVALLEMAPCRREPCPTYDAGVPYVGAAEANRGFFSDHRVAVGDRVELVPTHG